MINRLFLILISLFGASLHISSQPSCAGSLVVLLQGTSTGTPEGLVVKDSGNAGYSTLRNVIACAHDGDVITYDQTAPIPINVTTLNEPLIINKSLTFVGLDINNRPEIRVDFTSFGMNAGIVITNDKTVVFKDIDLRESNNPSNNDLISVQDLSMFKVIGKTVVNKD
ncbi:MAG TPA: hypothetical protein VK169_09040 [Saprospiraceae bacterium]|nr:hypothetical protein [Saprospiraceae bacterium]